MNVNADPASEVWQQIQRAVESLSSIARSDAAPDLFYGELVRALTELTSARACRVWTCETSPFSEAGESDEAEQGIEGSWVPIKATVEDPAGRRSKRASEAQFATLVAKAAKTSQPTIVEAGQTGIGTASLSIADDTLFQPVIVADEVAVMIELAYDKNWAPSQRDGAKHLATVFAEITSDFQRNWQLRQLRDREERREKLDRFTDRVHHSYELRRVAYAIVAEGRELIDCDRLSLVIQRGRKSRVLAVSGVQKPDRRSPTVQCIERLVKSKVRRVDPQWLESSSVDENDTAAAKYFAESNAKQVGLLPVFSPADEKRKPERIATLLVETFEETEDASSGLMRSRANWIVRHASNAFSNAVHVNRLPFLSFSRWLDRNMTRGKRIPWLAILTVPLAVALWFAAWKPTDFRIEARGELVPVERESIYAPRPGTVVGFPLLKDRVRGDDEAQGTRVDAGDTLVRLENADLEYELTSLLGEQATIDQQLETIAASVGQFGGSRDAESRRRYDDLTAQAAELRVKQASIARRIRLVNKERERLTIKSTIAGRILTWDVVNELMLRPVQQGDFLLEVVDVEGPWEIDLYVRDRHIGYVNEAQQDRSDPLSISFFHRSDPEQEHLAQIKSVAMATEVYPEYGSAVRVTGTLEHTDQLEDYRAGMTLIAKIDCGKKPLAYVLCYDLIHTIRMWGLF
ncbi:MAG: hypothetical protein AB8B91_21410 [Rubripirellula sp.]